MKKIIVILVLFTLKQGQCQVFGDLIEKNIQSTVLIKVDTNSGSGILITDTSGIYIITAKHLIFDAHQNYTELISNKAEIQFYAHNFKNDSANYIELDLFKHQANDLILKDSMNDICVLMIANIEPSGAIRYLNSVKRHGHRVNYAPLPFDEKTIMKPNDLFIGEDVFIVGFPSTIGLQQMPQFDYNKPLLKRGAIASISNKYNTFIIDCPVYGGNSGGPVFLERKGFNKYSLRLIGIVVQFIPFFNETVFKTDITIQISSYAVVVPIAYALKLINQRK